MCAVPNLYGSRKGVESDNRYYVAVRRRTLLRARRKAVKRVPVDPVHWGSYAGSTDPQQIFRATLGRLAPHGGMEFTGAVFKQLIGPGVYVWLRGDEVRYIGASRSAVWRAGSPQHHRIALGKEVAHEDSMLFYPCETLANALELESELIQALRPRLNHNGLWHRVSARLGYRHVKNFTRQYLPQPVQDPSS